MDTTTQHLLRDILGFVDGHVKFAETKNAAILAFAAGSLFAIAQVSAENKNPITPYLCYYMINLVIFFGLAILASLWSFFPQISIPSRVNKHPWTKGHNLLFFDDVRHYDCIEYIKDLHAASGINRFGHPITDLELMYAEEIIINAKIASRKFYWFKVAVWCILFGVLTPIIFPAITFRRKVRYAAKNGL